MPGLLVADDTEIIRTTISDVVTRDYQDISPVIVAENGDEAVQLARLHRPDIVFMDIKMPGLNGLQATSIIRQENPQIKIIMLTAYDEFSYVQEALKLGALDYLLKPVRPSKISEVIDHAQTIIRQEQSQQQLITETRQQLAKTIPLVEATLVEDMLFRQPVTPASFDPHLQQLNKTLTQPLVMLLQIEDFDRLIKRSRPDRLERQLQTISSIVQQNLNQPATALLGQWHLGQLAAILSTPAQVETSTACKAMGKTIRQRVTAEAHVTVTVSFGRAYAELESIPMSYAEARLAMRHGANKDGVTHIEDVKLSSSRKGHVYPLALEKELLENVRLKEEDVCLELLNEIVDDLLYKYKRQPQILYSYFAELLTMITRTLIETGALAQDIFALSQRQMAVLFTSPSPAYLRAWALNSLAELLTLVELDIDRPNPDAAQLAIEYIHKNHHKPDISLNEVAGTVGLSPSHLTYLLKERTGMSYSKYVTDLRLKHAKKLLRTTPLTVSSIAEAVGYPNATNFYRIFQRETGQTPKTYRDVQAQKA